MLKRFFRTYFILLYGRSPGRLITSVGGNAPGIGDTQKSIWKLKSDLRWDDEEDFSDIDTP